MEKLPTDIINLIVEYSVNKCELCETEIKKYIFDSSICRECAEGCISYQKKFSNNIEENLMIYFHIKRISSKNQIYKILYDI